MKRYLWVSALALLCLPAASASAGLQPLPTVSSVLPSAAAARGILDNTHRHREWVAVGTGAEAVKAFVVYPERAERAPAIVVSTGDEGQSDRVRATADQLAAEGFIAIAPQVSAKTAPALRDAQLAQVQTYAAALPAANGKTVRLALEFAGGRAEVTAGAGEGRGTQLPLAEQAWPQLVAYVSEATGEHRAADQAPAADAHAMHGMQMADMMHMDHDMMHMAPGETMTAAQAPGGSASSRMVPRLTEKLPNLPASYYTAAATLANSKLKHEWVDIPVGGKMVHTWVVYPQGTGKTGVVIVMQHGVGLDDWMRSVADQIAAEGFIAVAPDAWSGVGPNGGNRESFQFVDDAIRAGGQITVDETQRRYRAAREWALKLPRANGKVGSIGFCAGGNNSFLFAAQVPELNAAVVFYGQAPNEDLLKRINAPVLGFYGENDARVTSTVAPTVEKMRMLGKSYEPHIYPKVTHSFVYFQDLSVNRDAVADAWPKAMAFFQQHLK